MSRQEFDPARGRIKRTVLFHALEEGVVTAATLNRLTGLGVTELQGCLVRLRDAGMVGLVVKKVTPATGHRYNGHGLTPKGIEAAMQIDQSDVIFAKAELERANA